MTLALDPIRMSYSLACWQELGRLTLPYSIVCVYRLCISIMRAQYSLSAIVMAICSSIITSLSAAASDLLAPDCATSPSEV